MGTTKKIVMEKRNGSDSLILPSPLPYRTSRYVAVVSVPPAFAASPTSSAPWLSVSAPSLLLVAQSHFE